MTGGVRVVMDFGVELAQTRRRAALTRTQLAERTGLSRTYLSDLERGVRGQYPSTTTIVLCATALGVEPDHFRAYRVQWVLEHAPEQIDAAYHHARLADG